MSLFKSKTIVKRNMTKTFSEKVDQRLIALVQASPVLYDFNDPKYMDFNTREVAWQKIGDELEKPAADCKIRWINIRDVHRRILRRSHNANRSRAPRAYKYDKHLEFMRNFYKEVITTGFHDDENDEEPEEDVTSESWPDQIMECNNDTEPEDEKPLTKQKRTRKSKKLKVNKFEEVDVSASNTNDTTYETDYDVSDPVDSFLISIGATLKKFSPYHLNLAKSKIFHIVQEHDLQQIVEKQQGRLDNVSTSGDPAYYHG